MRILERRVQGLERVDRSAGLSVLHGSGRLATPEAARTWQLLGRRHVITIPPAMDRGLGGLLLSSLARGKIVTSNAADRGSSDGVAMRVVASHTADDGALDAAFRIGSGRGNGECGDEQNHVAVHVASDRTADNGRDGKLVLRECSEECWRLQGSRQVDQDHGRRGKSA